jgi:hypothetical protein
VQARVNDFNTIEGVVVDDVKDVVKVTMGLLSGPAKLSAKLAFNGGDIALIGPVAIPLKIVDDDFH